METKYFPEQGANCNVFAFLRRHKGEKQTNTHKKGINFFFLNCIYPASRLFSGKERREEKSEEVVKLSLLLSVPHEEPSHRPTLDIACFQDSLQPRKQIVG